MDCFIWTTHSTTIPYGLFYIDHPFHHDSIWTTHSTTILYGLFHIMGPSQYFSVPHVFRSEPIGFQADTQFPLGIRLVLSGSDWIPSGFRVEIVCLESDWNLTLFLIKKLIILILLLNIYNKKLTLLLNIYNKKLTLLLNIYNKKLTLLTNIYNKKTYFTT